MFHTLSHLTQQKLLQAHFYLTLVLKKGELPNTLDAFISQQNLFFHSLWVHDSSVSRVPAHFSDSWTDVLTMHCLWQYLSRRHYYLYDCQQKMLNLRAVLRCVKSHEKSCRSTRRAGVRPNGFSARVG